MKNSLKFLFLALVTAGFLQSCSDDDNGSPTDINTIVDVASGNSDLSTLVDALTRANLVSTLEAEGPYTVFAPTNAAFSTFLSANGFSSVNDVPTDILFNILRNHVVNGSNTAESLSTGYLRTLSTAGAENRNLSLFVNTESGVRLNNVASVSTADVTADNGIVHIVDAVIGLPTIVDHATANPELSSLVGALTANDNTTFTDLLSATDQTYTVFAPVNEGFTAFTNPNGNDINNVLSYHVISGDAAFAGELANGYLTTLATNADGDNLSQYVNVSDDGVVINGASTVAIADIVAINGVVHAVDNVIDLPTVVTFAVADPNFSSLAAALTTDNQPDFVGILSGDGPFTIFAPTNDAFQALLDSNDNWNALTDIDSALLTSVLQHHVLADSNIRSGDLTDGAAPNTLEGDAITINLPGTGNNVARITDGGGNENIDITSVDVQANNGVIHTINSVLLPNTEN